MADAARRADGAESRLRRRFVLHLALLCSLAGFAAADEPADPCAKLTELQCIAAADCTLYQEAGRGSPYACRTAADACERGFEQKSAAREECESKGGCVFAPQDCYCAPDVICVCGGGPPSQCRSKE